MQGLRALQRYFDFQGRSGRAEYWQFFGLLIAAVLAAGLLGEAVASDGMLFATLVYLALITPLYAVFVRRLHDRNRTGKWAVASLVLTIVIWVCPYLAGQNAYSAVGDVFATLGRLANYANLGLSVFLIGEFVRRGTDGENRFGPPDTGMDAPPPTMATLVKQARDLGGSLAAPTVTSAPVTARPDVDPLEQIERLGRLRDAGMITEDEFAQQKAACLSRL